MARIPAIAILAPAGVLAAALAVANRGDVRFSLDPFSAADPALAVQGPLWLFLFGALTLGILIGGFIVWVGQGRWRASARAFRGRTARLERELVERGIAGGEDDAGDSAPRKPSLPAIP